MAGGNSQQRRKLRRAGLLPPLKPKPSLPKLVPTQTRVRNTEPFNRADSVSVIGLLVGIFLVVVSPPLILKILCLLGVCVGSFFFVRLSHWTHEWSRAKQYCVGVGISVILLAVGVPQFISQWNLEHLKTVPPVM